MQDFGSESALWAFFSAQDANDSEAEKEQDTDADHGGTGGCGKKVGKDQSHKKADNNALSINEHINHKYHSTSKVSYKKSYIAT